MFKNARHIGFILIVLMLTLAISAAQAQDRVQITVLGTIKMEITEPFTEAVAAYNASQDQHEVVIIPMDGDPVQRMTTLSASGNMPNIINMGQEFSLFKDTLCDVTDTTYSQLAFPGTQSDVTVDGRVYGMPITIEPFGLLYNQAVIDEAVGGTFDPQQSTLAPRWRNCWLRSMRWSLVFFYLGFGVSLSTFLYHGFIRGIPVALDESAAIEGANKFQIFRHIIFPILKPTTTTIMILNTLWIWNDFLLPSLVLFINDRTLPLSMYSFYGQFTSDYGAAMAGLILSITPVIIFYIFMQRNILSGIAEGAVK